MGLLKWAAGTIAVVVAFCLFVGWAGNSPLFANDSGSSAPDPALSHEMDAAAAFGACEKVIKSVAINPSSAVIPRETNLAESGGFMFDWKKGDGLLLQNGFGAKLDTVATCVVAPDARTVTGLVIDGKKIIYRKRN